LSEGWAIDRLREEVKKWWTEEMKTIKAKLDRILEHIGDEQSRRTLREEVEAVGAKE